ncbi:MAG TPA: hypothetical protein PJ991_09070 [Kiritimatiellia bacterium]|nr:hypothetical protein [Kiritimatiellia bacterium]
MSANDFYDEDLIRQRDRATRIKMGPGDEPAAKSREANPDDALSRPVSELNLTRMARHKQEADTQATRTMQELEALRKRQEQLELEKRDLEEFKRKSEEFERGKRDVIANIKRSLTAIERDELETQRIQELLESTRTRFKALLADLEELNEQSWSESNIREELAQALGVIEDARIEYNKSVAKIESQKSGKTDASTAPSAPILFEDGGSAFDAEKSFVYWFKLGVAISLPLIITLVALAIVYFSMVFSGII